MEARFGFLFDGIESEEESGEPALLPAVGDKSLNAYKLLFGLMLMGVLFPEAFDPSLICRDCSPASWGARGANATAWLDWSLSKLRLTRFNVYAATRLADLGPT